MLLGGLVFAVIFLAVNFLTTLGCSSTLKIYPAGTALLIVGVVLIVRIMRGQRFHMVFFTAGSGLLALGAWYMYISATTSFCD